MPYKIFRSLTYFLLILSAFFLVAIKVSGFGYSAGGSTRWLRFGGITFQPSEFARFAIIIFLAYSLSKKNKNLRNFYVGFLPHVVVLCLFTVLIFLQPDFGSVFILGVITWLMMFVGGVPILYLLSSMIIFLPLVSILLLSANYRIARLFGFLEPWQNPANEGYQIIHSFMAFGTGGIWGTGIGKGFQKLFYLPEPHTDFILSVIGEELGLICVLIILGLYAYIFWRGIIISYRTKDLFGSYLAFGLTATIGLQVCINMGVALGMLPTKGLTLPFLSYGGTSLMFNMASIGILMNIGLYSIKLEKKRKNLKYV